MSYDYYLAVRNDVEDYVKNEVDFLEYDTLEELEEALNEDLWIEDSVTGNGSGSYTFSVFEAWENIGDNLNLLCEAAESLGEEPNVNVGCWTHGPEWWDVSIRCYLLPQAIHDILEEYEEEFNRVHEEVEED